MLSREKLIGFTILAVIAFLAALTIGYFVLFRGKGDTSSTKKPPTDSVKTIEVWGIFDDSDVYEPMFAAYEKPIPTSICDTKNLSGMIMNPRSLTRLLRAADLISL